MWFDPRIRDWFESVGFDHDFNGRISSAAQLQIVIERSNGRKLSTSCCQFLLESFGQASLEIDAIQLTRLYPLLSTRFAVFDSLVDKTTGCIESVSIVKAFKWMGYLVPQNFGNRIGEFYVFQKEDDCFSLNDFLILWLLARRHTETFEKNDRIQPECPILKRFSTMDLEMKCRQKVAVVTGGNRGIGLGIVKLLCQRFEGIVYLTSRDEERGRAAVAELKEMSLEPRFHQLDIESVDSIQRFSKHIQEKHGELDILVNNAGIGTLHNWNGDDIQRAERVVQVNYFGTLQLCTEMFPILASQGRVVNVSSTVGSLSKINGSNAMASKRLRDRFSDPELTIDALSDLMNNYIESIKSSKLKESGWPINRISSYVTSKVGICALTRMQQRNLDEQRGDEDILVNSVHPGFVDTELSHHMGTMTVAEGAEAVVWLALLPPGGTRPKGQFLWHDKRVINWVHGPIPGPY